MVATSPGTDRVDVRWASTLQIRRTLTAPIGPVTAISFTGDGRFLVAGGRRGAAVWDVRTGRLARHLDSSSSEGAAAASRDGRFIATAPDQAEVRVYDVRTGRLETSFDASGTGSLRFDPTGRYIAGASLDGTVELWNLRTHEPAYLATDASAAFTVASSPDGKLLAAGDSSGTVTLFDVASRKPIARLRGNDGGVPGLDFSPDGTTIVTIGGAGVFRLWDVASRSVVATLPGSTEGGSAAFFPDGRKILGVFGNAGTGVVWHVDEATWAATACRVANRELSRAEWRSVLPGQPYRPACAS
jgi:WD40 repeat protein